VYTGRIGLALLEGAIEGAVDGMVKCFGAEKIKLMILNDWYIIASIYFSTTGGPLGREGKLPPEELEKARRIRGFVAKTVLPILHMLRSTASRFPAEAVVSKINPEWLKTRGREKFPELVEAIEDMGDMGDRWLQNQCNEIVDFALGRSVYSPIHRRMITPEDKKEIEELEAWQRKYQQRNYQQGERQRQYEQRQGRGEGQGQLQLQANRQTE